MKGNTTRAILMRRGGGAIFVLTVLCLAFAARATDYTWTGGGGDGRWTNVSNWGGGGYPSSASDIARFRTAATVTIDTGAALTVGVIFLYENAGEVVLNGTDGTTLNPVKGAAVNGNGFVVLKGGRLVVNVPVAAAARVDKWNAGEVVFRAGFTNTARGDNAILVDNGRFVVDGTSAVTLPNGNVGLGNYTDGTDATMELRASARLTAGALKSAINQNANTAVGHFVQDGDETAVTLSGNIELAISANHTTPSTYELKAGTLDCKNVWLGTGAGSPARFIQCGGTARVHNIFAQKNVASVELSGGRLYLDYGIGSREATSFAVNFSGGTLATSTDRSVEFSPTALNLSGTPTFEISANHTNALPAATTFAAGTAFTKTGTGTLSVVTDLTVDGSLTVAGGTVFVNGKDADGGIELRAPTGDHSAWPVSVKSGGVLHLNTVNSRLTRPLALALETGAKVKFSSTNPYNRSALVAHSLTVNGTEKPKGRYTNAATSLGSLLEGLGPASIVVPYVWTGAGDGTSWTDAANWEGDAVPPSADTTCVDLSRAGGRTIMLDDERRLTCLVFNPQGLARTLTITGAGSLRVVCPDYYAAMIVGPGRELTLDVDVTKTNYATKPAIIGGGRIVVKKSFPGCGASTSSAWSLDGELEFAGTLTLNTTEHYKQFGLYTHEAEGHSRVVFGAGCTIASSDVCWRFLPSIGLFYLCDEMVQDGAVITMTDIFMTRHNTFDRKPFTYTLESGTLTLSSGVSLGCCFTDESQKEADKRNKNYAERYPGGDFVMNGGTLTLNAFTTQRYRNYFYLNGGDVYLKNGFATAFNAYALKAAVTNAFPVQLGGVRLHATGNWSSALELYLTGKDGTTEFDTAGYNANVNQCLSGPGGFLKSGAGTLYLNQTNSFTGPVTIAAGSVVFGANAVIDGPQDFTVRAGTLSFQTAPETALGSISVPSADALVVSAAASGLTVKRLVVGGVPKPAGTVAVNGGMVTVAGNGGASVWQGANGGAWSAAANWTGDVPDGEAAAVDFGDAVLAADATIALDADVTLKTLAYSHGTDGATLRLTGAKTLTLADGGAITVPAGNTLILDANLYLGGEVRKLGEGRLVLNGAVSSPGDKDAYWLIGNAGDIDVNGAVSACRLRMEDNARTTSPTLTLGAGAAVAGTVALNAGWAGGRGAVVQNGGTVDMTTPAAGFAGQSLWSLAHGASATATYTLNDGALTLFRNARFAEDGARATVVQNGGTLSVGTLSVYAAWPAAYTLNDGTVAIATAWAGDTAHAGAVTLNGGTVRSAADEAIFRETIDITLGGDVTFEQTAAGVAVTLASDITGAGTIRQAGPGTLTLAGGNFFLGALAVDGGTLRLASPVREETTLALNASGKVDVACDEVVVCTLTVGGSPRGAGVYSASGNSLSGRVTGAGTLIVLEGADPGTVLIFR